MNRKTWMLVLTAAFVGSFVLPALAAEEEVVHDASTCPICQSKARMNELVPWISWGADLRLREVYGPNLASLAKNADGAERHFQRYRMRAWTKMTPFQDIDELKGMAVNFRMVYEPRHNCKKKDADPVWTWSEGIIDKLNVQWKKPFDLPMDVTIGRQDIILGRGWLVLDGTPLDGSRTIYFDAVRFSLDLQEQLQTKAELIYLDQNADSDWWLNPTCDKEFNVVEADERGAIVYLTNKSLENMTLGGFFMYKHEEGVQGLPMLPAGATADTYCVGGSLETKLNDQLSLYAQGAHQFGNRDGADINAWGFVSSLAYAMQDQCNTVAKVSYEVLTGDDGGTGQWEQFDPMWGRWPQWSELFVYPIAAENGRPGAITNFHRVGLDLSTEPMDDLKVSGGYHLLFRDSKSDANIAPNGNGCIRGHLLKALAAYTFNPHVKTHVVGEVFLPGDFYTGARNDAAGFFRWEWMFTW